MPVSGARRTRSPAKPPIRPGILVLGDGLAVSDDAPERMAAHRFHDRVAVPSGAEARPHADHDRCVRDLCSKIFLCKDRVNQRVRPQPRAAARLRVGQHGNFSAQQRLFHIFRRLCQNGRHILHRRFAEADGL